MAYLDKIVKILEAEKANYRLNHESKTFPKSTLHQPSADFVDRVWSRF